MPFKYFCELVLLSALWGGSFLFMRTTVDEFGPVMLVTLRVGIAGLVLLPLLLFKRLGRELIENWRPIMFVGITNNAIPYFLFSYSTIYLSAGYASVLNATAPMFAAIIAFFWLKDKLAPMALIGLIIGFLGVFVLSMAKLILQTENTFQAILAALVATFFYGLAACFTKRSLQGVKPLTVAAGSLMFATVFLLPISLFYLPTTTPSINSWLSVLVLGACSTGFAALLFFRLIANVGAYKAITVTYLVPVFGIIWGMIFLREQLTVNMWIGAAMVLIGVALTTGVFGRRLIPKLGRLN
ncbi:MAG: DMT family transporter [Paraglaciecola sp.]|uniref:DMT family transporter n=1 Tax=Paraglaciecola sp. TaxID=1920173 RepID=UPI00329A1107